MANGHDVTDFDVIQQFYTIVQGEKTLMLRTVECRDEACGTSSGGITPPIDTTGSAFDSGFSEGFS